MITTIEVTLKINVRHPDSHLDENSVKGLINSGMDTIADNVEILSTISDEQPESICVSVVGLKVHGKKESVETYGTDEVPWGRA